MVKTPGEGSVVDLAKRTGAELSGLSDCVSPEPWSATRRSNAVHKDRKFGREAL